MWKWTKRLLGILISPRGDKIELENLTTEGLMSELNPQMKNRPGQFEWKLLETNARPKCVHFALAQVTTGLGEEKVAQATVRLELKQVIMLM